ncbi:BT0820 family HAD-type phosphatase [Draconibacterium orientale]|uniref:BT0820 family HAD-type phosphatase n=1 Tax=Draconibacterium orientale TaxID=1168034 RepID=UPI0029C02F40|nr:hydrolase [Draconibacterium orientale]
MRTPLTIAVDFDGTIVEHKYPRIGEELPFAIETLRALQEKGHKLILWTYRSEIELDEAVEFCREKGLEFYAVNKNYPEEKMNDKISRKILADLYIDDRNYGGMPEWTEIFYSLHPEERVAIEQTKSKSWWKR